MSLLNRNVFFMESAYVFFSMFWPLILGFALLVLIPFFSKSDKRRSFSISKFGIVIPISISQRLGKVILCLVFGFSAIIFSVIRDYSDYFPTNDLKYHVYYDVEGIRSCISKIREINENYRIDNNWEERRIEFYEGLDSIIHSKHGEINELFTYQKVERYLSNYGEADHSVSYTGFWQRYKIDKVSGNVYYTLRPPNSETVKFETRYDLIDKSDNFIDLTLEQFIKGRIVTKSTMAHSMRTHSQELYESEVVGLTKVRFFPINRLDFSLFCFEDEDNKLVPYAYAYYKVN